MAEQATEERQTWTYRGLDNITAKAVTGAVQASSEAEALDAVAKDGVVPLSVRRSATKSKSSSGKGKRARQRDVTLFIRSYTTAASSNMRTEEALQIALTGVRSKGLRWAVKDIIGMYSNGVPLHEAFAVHSAMFGDETAAVMEAGETSGQTSRALGALADSKERSGSIRGKIVMSMVYPVVIMLAAMLALAVIVTTVLPVVEDVIASLGGSTPPLTKGLLLLSDLIRERGLLVLASVLAGGLALKVVLSTEPARNAKSVVALNTPLVGMIVRGLNTSTLCELCGVMLSAGVTQVRAIELLSSAIRNRVVSAELVKIQQRLIDGMDLDAACKLSVPKVDPVIPALAQQTVSGISDPGEPWRRYGTAVAEETNRRADILRSAMEPMLIFVVGLVILLMAAAVYMPLLQVYEHLETLQ